MVKIPIKVEQFDDEPAWSVLRRLARLAGTATVRDFCLDFGLDLVAIENATDLEPFARNGGYDLDRLRRRSIVVRRSGYRIDGESILNNGVPRGRNRVCVSCLRDDLANGAGLKAYRPHWREWWFVHGIAACPFHRVELTISSDRSARGRMEADILDPRQGIDWEGEEVPVADVAAETYLVGRLGFAERRPHWVLDELSFGKAVTALRNFGTAVRYGVRAEPVEDDDDAKANSIASAGFAVLSTPEALDAYLDELLAQAEPPSGNWGPGVVYGRLYDWLREERKDAMSGGMFDRLRRIVRRHAERSFPLNPNEEFFGEKPAQRNLYTLDALWRRTGIHTTRWRPILLKEGLIDEAGADRPDWRILVRAEDVDALAEKLEGHMTRLEMTSRYGIPRATFAALQDDGALRPWLRTGDAGEGWQIWLRQDVEDWFDRLRGPAPIVDVAPEGTTPLAEARRLSSVPASRIVEAILAGDLRACAVLAGEKPWPAILLRTDEAKAVLDNSASAGTLGWDEAIAMLRTTHAVLDALVLAGRLVPVVLPGATGKQRKCFHPKAIDTFDQEFVSMKEAAALLGTHSRVLREKLAGLNVHPAFDLGISPASAYYRRGRIEALGEGCFRSAQRRAALRRM